MSGILSIMSISTNAMFAAQTGVEITSHNLANADTPGYIRQTPVYQTAAAVRAQGGLLLGRGVNVAGVRGIEDRFLDYQVNLNTSAQGSLDAAARGTDLLQEIVNESSGNGLASSVNAFFASLNDLAANPEGGPERTAVRGKAQTLVSEFHRVATAIDDLRQSTNTEIGSDVTEVNRLAGEIADLNAKIANLEGTGQSATDYRGARQEAMKDLAQYVDFHASEGKDGAVTIYLSAGLPLVEGATRATLSTTPDGSNGNLSRVQFVDANGNATDVTDQLRGGKIRGALDVRDGNAKDMQDRLDRLAYELAQRINEIHRNGYAANGHTGVYFFEDLGSTVDGAASRIALDPAILADVNNIAAAQTNVPGDNRNALAMADLQNAPTMNGGTQTFSDFYGAVVGDAGIAAQQNTAALDHQKAVTDQISAYRESVTGVSIDEEMTNLVKYQQAYQASAKMIETVSGLVETLMKIGE